MASISDKIASTIRVNISDPNKSRFSDSDLLVFFKQAIARTQIVGFKHQLDFMKSKVDFTLQPDATQYQLPPGFLVQTGVWRTDTRQRLDIVNDIDEFETMTGYSDLSHYMIDGSYIYFLGAALAETPMRIRYYADVQTDLLTLSSPMPWGGRLDPIICEYVTIRAFHVDRYDLGVDFGLLKDLEKSIMTMFSNREATIGEMKGVF